MVLLCFCWFQVEYVRVYQRTAHVKLGCNPVGMETLPFIECRKGDYAMQVNATYDFDISLMGTCPAPPPPPSPPPTPPSPPAGESLHTPHVSSVGGCAPPHTHTHARHWVRAPMPIAGYRAAHGGTLSGRCSPDVVTVAHLRAACAAGCCCSC